LIILIILGEKYKSRSSSLCSFSILPYTTVRLQKAIPETNTDTSHIYKEQFVPSACVFILYTASCLCILSGTFRQDGR
jgi:hypothetical protein